VMHPRIVAALDDEEERALLSVTRHGELFEEVTTHARGLGETAEFQLLSDLLRNGANAPTFEEIFREILDYDENVRDLLLKNPDDAAVAEERREHERLAGEELKAAIFKLRSDAYEERATELSRKSNLTAEELEELKELSKTRADMKRRRGQ
jgi:DNA primase